MLKETRKLYERLGKRAKLPAKALELLNAAGLKTPYKNVPYTIGNVYAVLNGKHEDRQVDEAIIKAVKQHIEKEKDLTFDLKELLQGIY
jgi:broad-specificity NMP kinase